MSLSLDSTIQLVPALFHGMRVDRAAKEIFTGYSRTQIQEFIEQEKLLHNGQPIKKRILVCEGDQLLLCLGSALQSLGNSTLIPEEMNFSIIYEDDDLFVIDKPPGFVVHPGAGHREGTFVHGFLHRFPSITEEGFDPMRPGLVHRLDKDTSGVLIAAKNRRTLAQLSEQFQNRSVKKEYIAFVHGRARFGEKEIQTQIGRDHRDRTRMMVVEEAGKMALSHVYVTTLFEKATKVIVDLKTGRTHQIRVHLQHIGHPIIGDTVYSVGVKNRKSLPVKRQMLHCHKITIIHPMTKNECTFIAKVPQDMLECELLLQ
ncbi:MAG: RluA family pseudouridine synthase [Chlamydia sp.]